MFARFVKGTLLGAAVIAASLSHSAYADKVTLISGAGATFPYPVYAKWAASYAKTTGVKLNYQSIGSGGGIKQITSKTVDFGASDAPVKQQELAQAGLMQFPMVMGGVVPVVNLPNIKPGSLRLSGEALADIYMGNITKWNDPQIAKLNPDLTLPNQTITVVHRADGSGTTWIFTNYLSKVSHHWADQVGNNKSVAWPSGVGGKGNEGVASYVSRIAGSIGYVEYAYALQNQMKYTLLENRDGQFVAPTSENFQAAAANADWAHAPGFFMVLTDQAGKTSWPITGATFILMHKQQSKAATAKAVLSFFDWAYNNGDAMAKQLDYVPMPDNVKQLVEANWAKTIKDQQGKAVWTQP